ncbi:alpha/beta hydrolase family protein [Pseudoxanthomonas dokdonensis]|uniref:Peptidase S9 n=1 Tax=Pseudoxanthomonas dokdonensis TaxID=344882 RepID=A0A0R0CQX8_9GAMM|nr:S9 family peptidase [Pseudoxanthomonas dokdonensis]KRG68049.1 peptidase S9 [Pseudoxanthomonas dokdonensis]
MRKLILATLLALVAPAYAQVDLDPYLKNSEFGDIVISPDGDYYAVTIPFEDRTGMAILRRADQKVMSSFTLGPNKHVVYFEWANKERLLIRIKEKFGFLDQPQGNGEVLAMDVGDTFPEPIIGYRATSDRATGTMIRGKGDNDKVAALDFATIPGDDRNVIVTVMPYTDKESWQRADRMDIYNGRRTTVARAPVKGSSFHIDNAGQVRFALGSELDNASKLFYRDNDQSEWKLINSELDSGHAEVPVGFSDDNQIAYLRVEQPKGPDAIVAFDTRSGTRSEVLRDPVADPAAIIFAFDGHGPVGSMYTDGKLSTRFFDGKGREARLYAMLQEAFPNEAVVVTSTTDDGKLAVVETYSDRDPGSFYLFDTQSNQAGYLLSRRSWVEPEMMAVTKPVELAARDGLAMRGYLTLPRQSTGKNLPLVVLPHGGPFGIYEAWGYDAEPQILAAAGYAVLQVNYRGSGNYGRAFMHAGARQWGGSMQDDLTDATRWAINEGIADGNRVCMVGASYGAYASLMGVAKEPDLYRCAAGYVGVYDLAMMRDDDIRKSDRMKTWTSEWIGSDPQKLAAASPNLLADRIKVPVFLAAGGKDETAPLAQSQKMERALKAAGVPVETLYYSTEGHGFYTFEHRKAYYTQLLDFLSRNIGGQKAK